MKNLTLNFLLLFFTLSLIEATSFGFGTYLKKKGVYYNTPDISNFDEYLKDRDPVLGWPSKSHLAARYDKEGSRAIPAFPDPEQNSCASMYGDSFTWGDHVEDEESVPNYLSTLLGCRVSNFGVSGYGTDQMLLRFKEMNDEAPVVILNHFSGDIRRNVTKLRNLMADSDSQYILLKPRYILNGQQIELLPLITPSREEAKCLAHSPEKCLDHEYYLPGGHSGVHYLNFPYTISLLYALKNEHIQAKLEGVPVWSKFYNPKHPSNALAITAAITREFVNEAKKRDKTAIIAITANIHDIKYFRTSGLWSFQPLIDKLGEEAITVLNLGVALNEYIGDRDPCELGNESCYGHFTAEGNEVSANTLYNHIKELKLPDLLI